jgi:hypothetical protein
MAVRYIIVPLSQAPDPYATATRYDPAGLLAMLDGQLDLDSVTVNPGLRVYRNAAWGPQRALLPESIELPAGGDVLAERFLPQITGAPSVLDDPDGFAAWGGSIERGNSSVYVAQSGGDQWILSQDGSNLERTEVLGWASAFSGVKSGEASLRFDTPLTRWFMLLGQVLAWVLVIGYLLRVRVRVDESSLLPVAADEQSLGEDPAAVRPDLIIGSTGRSDA